MSGLGFGTAFGDITKYYNSIKTGGEAFSFSASFHKDLAADVNALNNFSKAISSNVSKEEALKTHMASASVAAQNFANKMQESGLSVNDFIKAQKYSAVSFAAQNKSLANVRELLDEYNSGLTTTGNICKNTGLAQKDFAKAVGESNKVAGNYLGNLNGSKASMHGYIGSLISAKVATIGLQVATSALNMGLTMLVSWGISLFVKNVIQAKERTKEAAEEVISKYKEAQETLKSNKSAIDEISSDYERLSKGVDKFGNNISLSTTEYEKYHEITNKIANMFPEMIAGYDSQGNAIIKNKGKVEELTKAYEAQTLAAKQAYLQGAADIYDDTRNQLESGFFGAGEREYLDVAKGMLSRLKDKNSFEKYVGYLDESNHVYGAGNRAYKDVLKSAGYGDVGSLFGGLSGSVNDAYEKLKKNPQLLVSYIQTQENKISSALSDTKQAILANLEINNKEYQNLSENNKRAVQNIIDSLDANYLFKDGWEIVDVYADINTKLSKLFGSQQGVNAFEYMADAQDKLAEGKITIGKYQDEINDFVKSISGLDNETQKYAKLSFGLDLDKDNISKDFKNVVNQLMDADASGQFSKEFYESFVGKLNLPEFNAMLNNGDQFKDSITAWLQEHSGASAKEFSNWLNDFLADSANSISDSSSTILTAFSKASDAVAAFKNAMDDSKGTIKSGTEAFEGYADAYKKAMKLINQGYDLDNGKLYAYMEFLLGSDTLEKYGYDVDKLKKKLKELKGVFGDSNSLGAGFVDKLEKATEKTNGKLIRNREVIATYNKKTKEWFVDNNYYAEVADALGMTEDGLVACIQAMSTWSDVTLESLGEIMTRAKAAGAVYNEQFEGQFGGKTVVNAETLRTGLKANGYNNKQVYDTIEQLKKDKSVIVLDIKETSSAKSIIKQLNKLGLVKEDNVEGQTLDLSGTVDVLKSTGMSLTEIVDVINTLNSSGSIYIPIEGELNEDGIRTQVEELYNNNLSPLQKASDSLKNLGLISTDIVFNSNSPEKVNEQITDLDYALEALTDENGQIDLSLAGGDEVELVLTQLMHEKQALEAPVIMTVDTSGMGDEQEEVKNAILKIQEFQAVCNEIEINKKLGIDTTEAEKKAESLRSEIGGLDANILTSLSLDTVSVDSLKTSISNVSQDQLIKIGIDKSAIVGWKPEDKDANVKYSPFTAEVDVFKKSDHDISATIVYHVNKSEIDAYDPKNLERTVTYKVQTKGSVNISGSGELNGTAHLSGTAKASGDWGTATGGTALVGELGEEVIVNPHTGRWYTVGENGAEFANIPQDAIVFNHKQTESLFKYGHINSRGTALASGTAYASGVTSSRSSTTSTTKKKKKTKTKSTKKSSSKSSSKTNNDDYTDWIEIAISRVERAIKNLGVTAKSTFQNLTTRLKASSNEVVEINREISRQQKGANRYLKQANAVKLSDSLKKKVREGSIDIKKYDEKTRNLISTYKTWYEKSLACSDAVLTLKESLATLYKERFDEVQKDFSNQLSLIQSKANMLNEKVSALEAKGYLKSADVYSSLKANKTQEIKKMEEEKSNLEKMLAEGLKSGTIAKYSEAWYSMTQQINSTSESIAKANTELIEYNNTMRKINWEHFDYLQDRIAQIPAESKFLAELLDEKDLYNDNGSFTKYGTAKLGLSAQNYSTYINQAKQYAHEIESVNKLIEKDPYDTNLISRREELLKLQRESIKNANDEKTAIKNLVEEGINKELSSLKDLIDKYEDEIDRTKDLYEYQKKIKDQTSNIASLQKQLASYSNDSSEESRAKIQKLKVELDKAQADLQESQYEHSISEQKKLLSSLYDDYETTLNSKLDDVNSLVESMTDVVDSNGKNIYQTLKEISSDVGYGITAITQSIWNSSSGIGKSVDSAINSTQSNVSNMVANSNAYVKKYATGGLVDYTGIARVDGSKSKPELVLNPRDTDNLLSIVDKVRSVPLTVAGQEFAGFENMIRHAVASTELQGLMNSLQGHTVNQDVSNSISLNVNIDHVENYDEFVEKLKHDGQFEKFVQAVTTDRLVGGSALAKYKYSWK